MSDQENSDSEEFVLARGGHENQEGVIYEAVNDEVPAEERRTA